MADTNLNLDLWMENFFSIKIKLKEDILWDGIIDIQNFIQRDSDIKYFFFHFYFTKQINK